MSIKAITFFIIVFGLFIMGISLMVTKNQISGSEIITYAADDTDKPVAFLENMSVDIGEMRVNEIKTIEFELKNNGSRPLQITNITTSCSCTFGKIKYKDLETKQYSMHKQSGYVADINSGESASVVLIYKPSIMPVYGPVSRDVFISTNDPANSKLIFTLNSTVK